ncbi:MAG: hypothetical protein NTZ05_16885, partial [Chloroflexi bacterium]|nr:hypothetical protein [Chloroflexota bacterium]
MAHTPAALRLPLATNVSRSETHPVRAVVRMAAILAAGVALFVAGSLLGMLQEAPVRSAAYATLAGGLDP